MQVLYIKLPIFVKGISFIFQITEKAKSWEKHHLLTSWLRKNTFMNIKIKETNKPDQNSYV